MADHIKIKYGATPFDPKDPRDALRASLIQLMPWAVDLVRDIDGLPPLSDGN